mmetsp:Transcript_119937/g.311253  ORF Transcript_119937/g.311253 Transcript_119937/m.311253 type:complete len:734 (+) Transcript_119937:107-2308(+)
MRYIGTGLGKAGFVRPARSNSELERTIHHIKRESLRYDPAATQRKPWLDGSGEVIWGQARVVLAKLVLSHEFETIMGSIIVLNIVLMVYETDCDAECYPDFDGKIKECPAAADNQVWILVVNRLLLALYSMEIVVRMFVERTMYFQNRWNWLDSFVVLSGWAAEVLNNGINANFLRAFRVARLLRAARVLLAIRELYLLMSGLMSSLRTIAYGAFMLLAMLVLYAILVVQLIHPINARITYPGCERCARGFASVWSTSLTLFQQIVAGDSWGLISVPVIEANPWLAGPILLIVSITVGLGLMNLILAVIVERAAEAREQDTMNRAKQKEKDRQKTMIELATLCANMDCDGNGTLSLDELLEGFETSDEFQSLMHVMDVNKEDLSRVFTTIKYCKEPGRTTYFSEHQSDQDHLSYMQFCEQLHRVQSRDTRMIMLEITSVLYEVQHELCEFRKEQTKFNALNRTNHITLTEAVDHILHSLPQPSTESACDMPPHLLPKSPPSSVPATPVAARKFGRPRAQTEASEPAGSLLAPPPEEPPVALPASRATMLKGAACGPSQGQFGRLDGRTDIAEDLTGLEEEIEELRVRKVEVMKRLEGQVSMLSEHAHQVASCRESFTDALQKCAAFGVRPLVTAAGDGAELDRLREQVTQCRTNVNRRMREALQAYKKNVEEEDDILLSNSILMGALHGRMSTSGTAKQLHAESGHQEPTSGGFQDVRKTETPCNGMMFSNMV